jgi:hypothetical protein
VLVLFLLLAFLPVLLVLLPVLVLPFLPALL